MEFAIVFAGIVLAIWMLALLLQLGDFVTLWYDAHYAEDREQHGRFGNERANTFFWLPPLVVVAALSAALGIDFAARMVFDGASPVAGLLLLLGVGAALGLLGAIVYLAVGRRDDKSFAGLRRGLLSLTEAVPGREKLSREEVATLRERLGAIEEHQQVDVTRPGWTVARVTPVIVSGVLVLAAIVLAMELGFGSRWWLPLIALGCAALSYVIAASSARTALDADAAWNSIRLRQRAEVLVLLDGLERSSRKGVAGLSDRVARALQILREQQN